MKIRQIIESHITSFDLCPGAQSYVEWQTKPWLQTRIGGRLVSIFPMLLIREALCKHDVHHILTGYATDIKGEAELAAWELGSGGCHFNIVFWLDRMSFFAIGLVAHPIATVRAFLHGKTCTNLFRHRLAEVETWSVSATRKRLGLST